MSICLKSHASPLSLSHKHTLSLSYAQTLSLSLSLSLTHTFYILLMLAHKHAHTHIFYQLLSHMHTLTLSSTHKCEHSLSLTHTLTRYLSLSCTSTHPHTSTLSHSSILFLTLCAIHLTFWTKARFQEFRRKDVFEFKTLFFRSSDHFIVFGSKVFFLLSFFRCCNKDEMMIIVSFL